MFLSDSTHRAHAIDWRQFSEWCEMHKVQALPATVGTVCLWITAVEDIYKPSTIERHIASISKAHQLAGYDTPTRDPMVKQAMRASIRARAISGEPLSLDRKLPLLSRHLILISKFQRRTLRELRDWAIISVGYACGLGRDLVALDVEDLDFDPKGVLVTLRPTKTSRDWGEIRQKYIRRGDDAKTCPVQSLEALMAAARICHGPLFMPMTKHGTLRDGRLEGASVSEVVKRQARLIGLGFDNYSARSLRYGFEEDARVCGVWSRPR